MFRKTTVLDREKSLGFKWANGMSRSTRRSGKVRIVRAFLREVDHLESKFVEHLPIKLRGSADFNRNCTKLFRNHAPGLWPPSQVDRNAWLVNADDQNSSGRYLRNLYYDELGDREM